MRYAVSTLLLVPVLVLATACGNDEQRSDDAPASAVVPPAETPEAPSGSPGAGPADQAAVCDEVVAGIADFNDGDFDGTVSHFESAVPLAEAAATAAPSPAADDLLEAVRYYADLAPGDYPAASLDSPDFEKYKQITLGQCATRSGGPVGPDDGGGVFA